MSYEIALEDGVANCAELFPLYAGHYYEMCARMEENGVKMPPLNPRLDQYFKAHQGGWLLHYTVRLDGKAVGYSNIYLTEDMHNGEPIAQEDTIYILPEHRNGIGRKLARYILDDLKGRGVKRLMITTATDNRVGKVWKRMGFKPIAEVMVYDFEA